MIKGLEYVLILLFYLFSNSLYSQQSFSVNLNSISSGLPSNAVYDFHQDTKGFIWIASNSGITRYDGFEFITYNNQKQTSLPGSAIKEDKYGRIWYQNFDGYLYYVLNETLYNIEKQNQPGEYVPFGIIDDHLFIVQKLGVDIFDLKSLKLLKTIPVNTFNVLSSTVFDNSFYFLAENIVYKIDQELHLTKSEIFVKQGIKVNLMYNDGKKLFLSYKNSGDHTLHFLNDKMNELQSIHLKSKGAILTEQYLDGKYWIFSSEGFFVYNKDFKLVMTNKELGLGNLINKCLIDKNGSYWFSGLKHGLHYFADFSNRSYYFDNNELRRIEKVEDKYYLAYNNGQLVVLDSNFKITKKLFEETGRYINGFYYDDKYKLLFTFTSNGLRVLKNDVEIYKLDIAAKKILKLDEKYYAFASSGYVNLFKNPFAPANLSSEWDKLYEKNKSSLHENIAILQNNLRAKSIDFFDTKDQFLVTSNNGLFLFNTKNSSEFFIQKERSFASDIFSFNKKLYVLDNNGNLYIVYRSGKKSFLNPEIGIPPNSIYSIKRFDNVLYIVCKNRIFEYDLTYTTSKAYSYNTNLLNVFDLIKDKNKLIIVTIDRLVTINLDIKRIIKDIPQFYFNNFYVNNESIQKEELKNLKKNENNLRITYSLLDYGSNIEPKVEYRLNKKSWIKIPTGSREIQLTSLSPGDYSLEIMINNEIIRESILINVDVPLYTKWWFISSIVAMVSIIAFTIYLLRTRSLHRKITNLNEKIALENELRTSMLTSIKAQMNPHFFYNALNTIQSYIFSNDKYNATTYLAKFSKLTRMILEMSGEQTVKLEDEINSLKLYLDLEQMRFQQDFNYQLITAQNLNTSQIKIPSMLIQPYVENAVKHGLLHKEGHKEVNVIFEVYEDLLKVTIDDNGVGRKRSEEINSHKIDKPKSFSTDSNRKRLEILNHNKNVASVEFVDKLDENQQSTGTTVILLITINYTYEH